MSNSFNFIFETVLLCDSINYSFLKIKLSASPALHQAHPIISVITQINALLRLTVCVRLQYNYKVIIITNKSFNE